MKKIRSHHVLCFALLVCIGFGCSGASGSSTSTAGASPASGPSSGDGGTWSAVIDGKLVSGTGSNGVSEVSLQQNATIDGLSFEFGSYAKGPGFQFVIKKNGVTELKKGVIETVSNYRSADGTLYVDLSATVTITKSKAPRTTGTFSGTWKNAHYGKSGPGAPETIQITDGKFDLP
jgi:hypothetical protein